ncbi:MAG: 1-(5-phosphoribosyl)-5-[(5-phosphoribosylamino)methylideneamino]imidazole-4-carboxamide isomerase [Woeseiaceae bacterium]|nr:1-(5-phosphoribosyl)-5-[(5-phosphoribosylamino)methylideneamino]imidazole-4-carboxamide isomerase [Woeseiaceae bacterium]
MNVIPAIDLQDGKCVRLLQGDFARRTEYSDDPAAVARQFAGLAATDLHVVDLDGARSGDQKNRRFVAAIAGESQLAIQLGGGIRSAGTLAAWFDAGVARCVIGSLAVTEPATVRDWLGRFGPERIVLALDVRLDADGTPRLTTHGWTETSATTLTECIDAYLTTGLERVLCTDVSRDGALAGPNLDLYASVLQRYPGLRLQASGGIRDVADLEALRAAGIPEAITGRALLDGRISAEELARFRQNA